jgi:CRP-like cAMP-binding protein
VVRRLSALARLHEEDRRALEGVLADNIRRAGPHTDLACEGDAPVATQAILSGWALRYKTLEDGRRQIINLLLPGDTCDYNAFLLRELDHSVGALTPVIYAEIPSDRMEAVLANCPTVARALARESLVMAAIQREWTVNLGQRRAFERVAHLLCEVYLRLQTVGLAEGLSCTFPLTQTDLAEATGLSTVHVNRTLQELRRERLIVLQDKSLQIRNLEDLMSAALFYPNYLHLA